MQIYKSPRLRIAAIPLAVTLGLGLSACGTSTTDHNKSSNVGVMTDVRLIGAAKDGYTNAVNGGEQANIYSPVTLQTVGRIANNEAFEIICDSVKPNAFTVEAQGVEGNVNLADNLVEQLSPQDLAAIPDCQ